MQRKTLMIAFLLLLFLGSSAYLIHDAVESYLHQVKNQEMAEKVQEGLTGKTKSKEILPKFADIYAENEEFAGWIKIEDTLIDYPVMKPQEDNNYYLTHGPDGNKSKYGAIYMDAESDLLNPSTNFILYGHYFRDGSMFGQLKNYKDKNFYEEHPVIQFDTLYEEGTYEVIAVFQSEVFRKNQDVFKYYQFTNINTQEEFDEYVSNIKQLSLYETEKTAKYGDSIITLSTCDYWTENGRLAVVAKKIKTN